MNQSELKELRSMLLRVKHKTGVTLDECIDFVDKRIKPEVPTTYCRECKHFIHRDITIRGTLKGVCELSSVDLYHWKWSKSRRNADTRHCRKFEKGE